MRSVRLMALIVALIGVLRPEIAAAAEPVLRIGVLRFGTVSWQLDVVRAHGLDRAEGFGIDEVELASTPAVLVALQAGQVDSVVSDWLWVSRQRAAGADWSFIPFSTAVGAVIVPAASTIRSLTDLKRQRLGVAGSALDKSWLILRLLAQERDGFDLAAATDAAFAAPPLLEEQILAGRLDAVLTYWPFAARLEAKGMRRLMSVGDAMRALGIQSSLPMVGYIVSDAWSRSHEALIAGFVRAARRADEILATSDAEWERIAPRTGARDAAELGQLRDAFRAGIPSHWGDAERGDAARLYDKLAAIGGEALVGPSRSLAPGTFLDSVRY